MEKDIKAQAQKKFLIGIIILAVALVIMTGVSLLTGAGMDMKKSLAALLDGEGTASVILWKIRLPRILMCILAGAVLSVCGAALQGLFKNPLCDPHILGVSSGAGLGAAIAIALGFTYSFLGVGSITLMAFATGILSIFLVTALAKSGGKVSNISLLLSGIAVGAFMGAGILLVMRMAHDKAENIIFWTMGSMTFASYKQLLYTAPIVIVTMTLIMFHSRELDMLSQGETWAAEGGVNVALTRNVILILAAIGTAAVVAGSGIIGFVGLMIPHVVRMIFGPKHSRLLPLSALLGAVFLLLMDTLARIIIAPLEIPVGILTAMVGAPFFIYILKRSVKND
ncbi:MAG: iron ABC transporter permease [Clostridiales bacterium]|nr:iron ABC transporter permease [Clostridiales bacterium]